MDIVLLQKVRNLGALGDKVAVKAGYGRNFLIPKGIAVRATAENIAQFEAQKAELIKRSDDQLAAAQAKAETLNELVIEISARAGEHGKLYGSIGTRDLAQAISDAAKIAILKSEIRLPEGTIREVGEYPIEIQLHSDVVSKVNIKVIAEE